MKDINHKDIESQVLAQVTGMVDKLIDFDFFQIALIQAINEAQGESPRAILETSIIDNWLVELSDPGVFQDSWHCFCV